MKCCAPPIVSAVDRTANPSSAASVMQALLFSEILKPLATALGPVGETVIGSVAQTTFLGLRP